METKEQTLVRDLRYSLKQAEYTIATQNRFIDILERERDDRMEEVVTLKRRLASVKDKLDSIGILCTDALEL